MKRVVRKTVDRAAARKPARRDQSGKALWKPGAMLSPVPVVLVTCMGEGAKPNILTIAWTGTVCSDPPMLSVAVRPERYSYRIIRDSGEFVVNVPSVHETKAVDYCGVVSGREVDKFEQTGLTPAPASKVRPPIIAECPVNIECRVQQEIELGTHTLFLARVVAVQADEGLITPHGRLALERAGLIAYAHGHYFALGKELGFFGFSVQRRKRRTPPARS